MTLTFIRNRPHSKKAFTESLFQNSSMRGENGSFENRNAVYVPIHEYRKRGNCHLQTAQGCFETCSELHVVYRLSLAAIIMAFPLSACASSTTDPANDPVFAESSSAIAIPVPMTKSEIDGKWLQSQTLRNEAIAEIRAKARSAFQSESVPVRASQEKMSADLLSPEEISGKIEEMNAVASQSGNRIRETELELKRHTMNKLLQKGKTHYKSALKRIEKK